LGKSDQLNSFIDTLAEGTTGKKLLDAALYNRKGGAKRFGRETGAEKEAEAGDLLVLAQGGSGEEVGGSDDANFDQHPNQPTSLPTHSPTHKPTEWEDFPLIPTAAPTLRPTEWYQDCPVIVVKGVPVGKPQWGRMGEYTLLPWSSSEYRHALPRLGNYSTRRDARDGRPVYMFKPSASSNPNFFYYHAAQSPNGIRGHRHFKGRWIIGPSLFSPSGGLFVKSNARSPADVQLADRLDRAWANKLHKQGKTKWEKKHAQQGKWKAFEGGGAGGKKGRWQRVHGGISSHCKCTGNC
jgi:hypothetical protein